ncbi:DUF2934 domain-containing protein [Labrys sp. 22185]|uniref:DUF2934 domain-containing protein n=1 Tax=Labrys sp. 22185 TaxID=3453888 RepID=UPI003F84C3BC
MQKRRDERIQERAYQIWEAAGRPIGKAIEHWAQAEREAEDRVSAAATDVAGKAGLIVDRDTNLNEEAGEPSIQRAEIDKKLPHRPSKPGRL